MAKRKAWIGKILDCLMTIAVPILLLAVVADAGYEIVNGGY